MNLKSDEEKQFYAWLTEAMQKGLVSGVEYEPPSYELIPRASIKVEKKLKTKTKIIDKFLFHPHKYTGDFAFEIHHAPLLNHFVKICDHKKVLVDTKGTFMNRGAKQEFSINRKLLWAELGLYVNKVVPKELFKSTWCPMAYMLTPKTGKRAAISKGCKNITEYMEERK